MFRQPLLHRPARASLLAAVAVIVTVTACLSATPASAAAPLTATPLSSGGSDAAADAALAAARDASSPLPVGRSEGGHTAGRYIVVLKDEATTTYRGGIRGLKATASSGRTFRSTAAGVAPYRAYLQARQREITRSLGVKAIASWTIATNGFAAQLTAAQATALASDPRVSSLVKNEIVHVTDDTTSTGYLGLEGDQGVWDSIGGVSHAGEGVVVGVVDTGIAPENLSFAGDPLGTTDGTEPYQAGDTIVFHKSDGTDFRGTCVTGVQFTAADCTTKIVGARYFVDGFGTTAIGTPATGEYLSPRDGVSHGSHTSSTAAGDASVTAEGYGATISGVAPAARIAVYKACWSGPDPASEQDDGCATADLLSAIDAAVSDGVDVINYSIGAGAAQTTNSVIDQAFMRAASAGIFVAASAGNSGPDASTLDNASPWITTVAASTIPASEGTVELGDGSAVLGVTVSVPAAGVSGPLVYAADVAAAGAQDPSLCAPGSLDPARVAGTIVLCDRGTYARVDKSAEVKRAGGIGMVLVNLTPDSTDTDSHAVPTVHVDAAASDALHAYAETAGATATLRAGNTQHLPSPGVPQVAGFSSRGPVLADGSDLIKPDIAAPGVNILAATANAAGASPHWGYMSGTSMASPHIAGLAALYLGVHPIATPAEIKSALMTSTVDTVDADGSPVTDPFVQGNGEVHPQSYLDPGFVYLSTVTDWTRYLQGIGEEHGVEPLDGSDLNLPSIGIGALAGVQTVTRTVTATQAGDWTPTVSGLAGVDATVAPSTLHLAAAGDTATYTVTFRRTDAPLGAFTSGTLTWTDGATTVRSALAVQPVAFDAPAEVGGAGVHGAADITVHVGDAGEVPVSSTGLAHGIRVTGSVKVGETQRFAVDVPSDTDLARFALDATDDSSDLDLVVQRKSLVNGLINDVGASATGSADEQLDVASPARGVYIVEVSAFAAGADGAAEQSFTLTSWVVGADSADAPLTLDPTSIDGKVGDEPTVTASWNDLEPGQYLGVVRFGDTGISTIVSVDAGHEQPVAPGTPALTLWAGPDGWLTRGNLERVTGTGLTPGATYTVSIDGAGELAHAIASERGVVDIMVPAPTNVAGTRALTLSGAGTTLTDDVRITPIGFIGGFGITSIGFDGTSRARLNISYAGHGPVRFRIASTSGTVFEEYVDTLPEVAGFPSFSADSHTVEVDPGELVGTATVVLPDGSDGPTFTVDPFFADAGQKSSMTFTPDTKHPGDVTVRTDNRTDDLTLTERYYGCDGRQVFAAGFAKAGVTTETWHLAGFRKVEVIDSLGIVVAHYENLAATSCDPSTISIAQNFWGTVTAPADAAPGTPLRLQVSFRYAAYSAGFDLYAGEGEGAGLIEKLAESIPTPIVTAPSEVISRSIDVHAGTPLWAQAFYELHLPSGIIGLATTSFETPALSVEDLAAPALGTLTTSTPVITGTAKVGSTLHAKVSSWHPAPVALTYQWSRNGHPITGATGITYRLKVRDAGQHITVTVTGTRPYYQSSSRRSPVLVVLRPFAKAPSPTIVGTFAVGHRLTAKAGTWSPSTGVTFRYAWWRSGVPIAGAHGSSYVLTAADRGRTIRFTLTATKAGYETTVRSSALHRVR